MDERCRFSCKLLNTHVGLRIWLSLFHAFFFKKRKKKILNEIQQEKWVSSKLIISHYIISNGEKCYIFCMLELKCVENVNVGWMCLQICLLYILFQFGVGNCQRRLPNDSLLSSDYCYWHSKTHTKKLNKNRLKFSVTHSSLSNLLNKQK